MGGCYSPMKVEEAIGNCTISRGTRSPKRKKSFIRYHCTQREIPIHISYQLQVNLWGNQLSEFPLVFCGLKHLDVLDLSHNRLTLVPDGAAELHVTELNLNQNQIAAISERLADCPRLKTLRLEENCLQIGAIHRRILEESKVSVLALEGNLFEMKQFPDLDGYDKYMGRYTAVKKKMF